jgi:hypothetical protein
VKRQGDVLQSEAARQLPKVTNSSSEPVCILVLGMHRSGASAFAGVLGILGCALPKNLVPPSPSDPKGRFEPKDIVEIHDEMLAALGSSWADCRRIDPADLAAATIQPFKQALLAALKRNFGPSKKFILKDPRICRFFPFWHSIAGAFGAELRVVIPLQNPIEVARSLAERDHLPLNHGLNLWLRHVLDTELDTRGTKRIFVPYSDLLGDWRLVIEKIEQTIDVKFPVVTPTIEAAIESLLEQDVRQRNVRDLELDDQCQAHPWVLPTYRALNGLIQNDHNPSDLGVLDRIREPFDQAATAFGAGTIESSRIEELEAVCARLYREMRKFVAQDEDYNRRLSAADRDLRRLTGEVEEHQRRLAMADGDLRRLMEQVAESNQKLDAADIDLRRLIMAVEDGESKLAVADRDLRRLMEEVVERNRRLDMADIDMRRLIAEMEDNESKLAVADRDLRRLMEEVAERDARLVVADQNQRRLMEEVAERDASLVVADRDLRRLIGEIAERDARLVAADRDLRRLVEEVAERDARLVAADHELRRLVSEVAERD